MPAKLVRALESTLGVDEFIVCERRRQALVRQLGEAGENRRTEDRQLEAHLFVDHERGRGQSRFLAPPDTDTRRLVRDSAVRALSALGPSWRLQPPAAPARLDLSELAWNNLGDSSAALVQQFRSHTPSSLRVLHGELELSQLDTRVVLSNGFDNHYRGTAVHLNAQVQAEGGLPVSLHLRARQGPDLHWQRELEAAARRSLSAATAQTPQSGPCDLLLMAGAYLPLRAGDFGIWTPLVRQSEAARAARGLARYQLGQEILERAPTGDSLTLSSDGSMSYGLRSAPFDDQGQAVRRFSLVENGRAAGHAMDYRDAAREKSSANGGVRNLVVVAGATPLEQLQRPEERPLLVVHRLSDLYTEDRGACVLRVDSGEWRHRDAAGALVSKAVRGGVLSGNLYDWLSRAHFARETENHLWYQGPRAIRFNQLRVQS